MRTPSLHHSLLVPFLLAGSGSLALAQQPAPAQTENKAPAPAASSTAPAQPAQQQPAAPAQKALPYLAVVPMAPAAGVKPAQAHHGKLLALLVEHAALQTQAVNVITQGAQAEMLEDMGIGPDAPIDEATAKKLAQLSGATSVLYGTFEPAEGGAITYKLRHFGVLAGAAKDLITVTATPADAAHQVGQALSTELAAPPFPPVTAPSTEKAQKGYVTCATQAAIALERAAVKGRKVTLAPAVKSACKDAAADKATPLSQGVALAMQTLTGDKKAATALKTHVDAHPEDRLAALALVRWYFEQAMYEEASSLFKRVKETRPRDPDVLRMEGELEIQKDNWTTARFAFQQAVNQAPNSPYLRYRLSYASYRTDQPQDALEHARAALRLAGGDAPFYQLNLAERLLDAGQHDEAILQLERSVKQTPNRFTPRVRLGYAYLLRGDADAALQHLTAAEKMTPTEREKERGVDMLLKLDLARAHALKGNTKDAMKYLKALEKAGALEKTDLAAPEFQNMKETPEFKKLKAL
ncbi:MAG: tetratricopeptide repeat protein [Myxococcota bacterium]